MNLDGYIRVSRVGKRDGESFISPGVQRERIEAVATAGGHRIIRWHEDLDQSGAKADRPGFQAALDRIETGKTDGIVVAKLDRFSRSVAQAAEALKRIEKAGGAFLSAEDSLDTSTPIGRFALHMMLAIAELEWERRRESWEVARANAVARGIHIASRTPTGYDRDDARRLVPNQWAPKITEAFKARAQGASWGDLARILDGVPSPYGAAKWTSRSMTHMLSNPVYLGEARSGEFVNPAAHPPLIDQGTWQLAQRREARRSERSAALLSGLLRCAGCRYAMKPDRMTLTTGPRKGERVRTYRCRGTRSVGRCPSPASVLGSVIEPWVESQFLARLDGIGAEQAERAALDAAQAERDEALAQRDAFLELTIEDPVAAQRELDRRQERLNDAEAHLADLLAQADGPDVEVLRAVWEDLTVEEQREAMTGPIETIFLRRAPNRSNVPIDTRAIILFRGEAPSGLPGPGRKLVPMVPYDW